MRRSGESVGAVILGALSLVGGCGGPERVGVGAREPGLVQERMLVEGHSTIVRHSAWDAGRTQDVFDADPVTLARTRNANPAVLELVFGAPRLVERIALTTASRQVGLRCTATLSDGQKRLFSQEYRGLPPDPTVVLELVGLAAPVAELRVEVTDLGGGDGHIHIRTLKLS